MAKGVGDTTTITGAELRRRLDVLRPRNYVEAAQWLGLTRDGLAKAFAGKRPVSRQTQTILELREEAQKTLKLREIVLRLLQELPDSTGRVKFSAALAQALGPEFVRSITDLSAPGKSQTRRRNSGRPKTPQKASQKRERGRLVPA